MTTKLEKEYEVLRNDFNTRSTLARDAFMQTKISHALDTNCIYLGVTIDSKFTCKPQVEAVAKRVNRALYSLNFFCHFTTLELRKRLVSALVLSHLDYCSTVYLNISGDLKDQIQRLQNKCIRYVTGLRRDDYVTPARRQLGWLTTDMWRMYAASFKQNICQSFLKRVNVLTLAEVTPSPSSNCHPGLRRLVRNLLCTSVQNSVMNCPTEYATSLSRVVSKLLCTIIYSIQIPNSLLSH